MESDRKVRQALKHKVRPHRLEMAAVGDEVYYRRDNTDEWRGPAKVIGRDGKVVRTWRG